MSKKGNLKFYKYIGLIIAFIIIIIVVILDIIFENYSKTSIKKINGNIEKIYNEFENNDEYNEIELEKVAIKAKDEWEKREDFLACFIEHDEIEKVNIKLNLLVTEIKNEIWTDAKSTTAETRQLVKYLNKKHKLSLQNLF